MPVVDEEGEAPGFTYDPTSSRGRVRLLIPDRRVPDKCTFSDADIDTFLDLEADDVFLAAALAIETAATNQVLILKVIKNLDLTTDGAKVSDSMLKRAKMLRERASELEDADDPGFEIAEMVVNSQTFWERLEKQAQRGLE